MNHKYDLLKKFHRQVLHFGGKRSMDWEGTAHMIQLARQFTNKFIMPLNVEKRKSGFT